MGQTSIFDDSEKFSLIHHFHIPAVYTWGDRDKDKREEIRRSAFKDFPAAPFDYAWYGFRIKVLRNKTARDLDLENVPKLIIDAFSGSQIDLDRSSHPELEIYRDNHLKWVRAIQVEGQFTNGKDSTEVWIFGKTG